MASVKFNNATENDVLTIVLSLIDGYCSAVFTFQFNANEVSFDDAIASIEAAIDDPELFGKIVENGAQVEWETTLEETRNITLVSKDRALYVFPKPKLWTSGQIEFIDTDPIRDLPLTYTASDRWDDEKPEWALMVDYGNMLLKRALSVMSKRKPVRVTWRNEALKAELCIDARSFTIHWNFPEAPAEPEDRIAAIESMTFKQEGLAEVYHNRIAFKFEGGDVVIDHGEVESRYCTPVDDWPYMLHPNTIRRIKDELIAFSN